MKDTVPGIPWEPAVEEYCVKPQYDSDGVQSSSGIGVDGMEYPDPVPAAPPVGYSAPPDLMQMIRTMIHSEQAQRAYLDSPFDTPDEAEDFDIEDDPLDPLTPYERHFLPQEPPSAVASPSPSVPAKPTGSGVVEGGEAAGSPNKPAPAAPSDKPDAQSLT